MQEVNRDLVRGVVKKIEVALANGAEILLFKASTRSYSNLLREILRFFTGFADGIYVSFNKPCKSLRRLLSSAGVNVDRLVFIDCVSRQYAYERGNECIYVSSPDPVHIQVALRKASERLNSERKFVFFDSLSTISLYKSKESMIKFLRQVTGKLRMEGFVVLLFTLEGELDEATYAQVFLMSDEVIELV